ncbi:MAG: SLC13 family permease [Thermoanaerobaculia bacterium]
MTPAIAYVLALLVGGLILFAWDRLSVDTVALILLLALALPGVLTPKEALAGFADETVIALIALFVLTAGVVKTGVVVRLGMRLASVGGRNPVRLTKFILIAVTAISAFFSNTVTTAVFLPIVIGIARRAEIPLSRVLMPLAFASILSSPVTLISTSTNVLISGQLPRYGLAPIGFFEMAPAGIAITVLGMLYLLFVAPRLIPDREGVGTTEREAIRKYLTEVVVTPGSPLHGKTLAESRLGQTLDLNVVGIARGARRILAPGSQVELREGDILMIEGRAEDILLVKDTQGVEIHPDVKLSDPDLESGEIRMVEAMVLPRSGLVGATLREAGLREKTGLTVLAVHSAGGPDRVEKISRLRLKPSDVLLLQGRDEDIRRLPPEELLPLEDLSGHHPRSPKGPVSAAIFVGAVALGATGLLPLPIAFLLGSLTLVLTRCLTPEEAYEAVPWRMMVLIGGMIAFGGAMEKTGTAAYLADFVVGFAERFGHAAILAGFFLLTALLTQPMSNQAAALVMLPIAVRVAQGLEINPRTLVMVVTFAASCSFLTPLEPSCVLVYGPGRYRFFDFSRVGGLLTLIVFAVSLLLIPIFWPLR